jgi:hypothetical protein
MKSAGKHDRYKFMYKPDEVYWGLGIENETYLEIEDGVKKPIDFLKKNHKRERYSVDYYKSFNFEDYQDAISIAEESAQIILEDEGFDISK